MRDRRDGKLVKNIDGMHVLMPYLKPKRCDSDVFIKYKFDVTELVKYVEKKKKENPDVRLTYFHVFVTAIGKVVYNRPLLNRFVVNKRYYDRNNVSISFVAKGEFTDDSKEFMSTVNIEKDDNLESVRNKVLNKVNKTRKSNNNSTDKAVDIVGKLPKFIRDIAMSIFLYMDRHDILPKALCEDNIYYSSILVSNLGSIDCGAIYHNLTDFGTNSIVATIGDIHKEQVTNKEGKTELRDVCEFGINLDERIADGFYFIKSVKLLEEIFNNPILLEESAESKILKEKN